VFGKLVCLLALAAGMLIADLPKLGGTGRGERLLYGALCAVVLYLAVIFVTDAPLPNLDICSIGSSDLPNCSSGDSTRRNPNRTR